MDNIPVMSVDELKKIAKSMGYKIIPIEIKEKLIPCLCGCKKSEHWSKYDKEEQKFRELIICPKCGRQSSGWSEADARRSWNLTIKEEEKKWKQQAKSSIS